MSDAPADFSFDDLQPHVPKTAAQVGDSAARELADSVERGREKVARLTARPELTRRQKLGNRVFFYVSMCIMAWMAVFLTWDRLSLWMGGRQVKQIRSGFDVELRVFDQNFPTWSIALLLTFGAVMSLLNLLKLTGLRRRYIFATFGLAILMTLHGFVSMSPGHHAGFGLWTTLLVIVGVCIYSWKIRESLR